MEPLIFDASISKNQGCFPGAHLVSLCRSAEAAAASPKKQGLRRTDVVESTENPSGAPAARPSESESRAKENKPKKEGPS